MVVHKCPSAANRVRKTHSPLKKAYGWVQEQSSSGVKRVLQEGAPQDLRLPYNTAIPFIVNLRRKHGIVVRVSFCWHSKGLFTGRIVECRWVCPKSHITMSKPVSRPDCSFRDFASIGTRTVTSVKLGDEFAEVELLRRNRGEIALRVIKSENGDRSVVHIVTWWYDYPRSNKTS